MSNPFFDRPILNSPYLPPSRHWELDHQGQPTQKILERRRPSDFVTPIPKPKRVKDKPTQQSLLLADAQGLSTPEQQYHKDLINRVRQHVGEWRRAERNQWKVTHETALLLQHWRDQEASGLRPFFCQVEAVETAIWLTEVAPHLGKIGKDFLEYLEKANQDANPEIFRIALKLATGSGKTTVMAMLIAWQTINAVKHPRSERFTKGFLLVTPGLTIRDRLRVLQPNDPENYYEHRHTVPPAFLPLLKQAKITITNYHAFKLRERFEVAKGTRELLQGHDNKPLQTLETEGQMLQRVIPELLGLQRILVINDEAHHCYRTKPEDEDTKLKGEEKQEAEKNNEAARLWISGIEAVKRKWNPESKEAKSEPSPKSEDNKRKIGVRVFDLSATPFFLRGSGYAEGTLFPWTMSDFSLMDAIECGIVKLPRVPVADNIPGGDVPKFRDLWTHIGSSLAKAGRSKSKADRLDPLKLPTELKTALDALYGHYAKIFEAGEKADPEGIPPCMIIVCNNTSTSKLVFDYVSGFHRQKEDGTTSFENGRLALFRNYDESGIPLSRPRTLLIDSEQLESGEALHDSFREAAKGAIDHFRNDILQYSKPTRRTGSRSHRWKRGRGR